MNTQHSNPTSSETITRPHVERSVPITSAIDRMERPLTIEEASMLTAQFRSSMKPGSRKGGFLGRNIFEKILAQEDCFGIRAYFAAEENGALTIVLVGLESTLQEKISGVLGEDILPCPPHCGSPNALNSSPLPGLRVRHSHKKVFSGEENHRITLAEAKRLISNYDSRDPKKIIAGDFSRESLHDLLKVDGCLGIRAYFGTDGSGRPQLVMVAANGVGDDLLQGPILQGHPWGAVKDGHYETLG